MPKLFDFVPKFLVIGSNSCSTTSVVLIDGVTTKGSNGYSSFTTNGNKVSWTGNNALTQLNSGVCYYIVFY